MNTDELRAALADQERFAPQGQAVMDDLAALLHPRRRRPHFGSGLLAAAAVAGIAAATTMLLHPAGPSPDRSTTSSTTAAATATSATPRTEAVSTPRALPNPTSLDQSQAAREAQAQRRAEQAASSAEAAANTAGAAVATAAAQCEATTQSHHIDLTTAITSATIRPVVVGCAKAWGPAPGYTVEWVQTTVGQLQTLSTGRVSRDTRPVVAIQIHAVFTKGGQSGPAETMLIHLRDGSPPGVDVPTNPLNLAALGEVHHW